MKKLVIIELLIVTALLCGCSLHIPPKKAAIAYTTALYGDATCTAFKEDGDRLLLTMHDKEYDFTYHVTLNSGADALLESDFSAAYITFLANDYAPELDQLKRDYAAAIEWTEAPSQEGTLAKLTLSHDVHTACASVLGSIIQRFDTRQYFRFAQIPVYCGDELLGSYYLSCGEYIARDDSLIAFYQKTIYQRLAYGEPAVAITSPEELAFLRKDLLSEEELHEMTEFTAVYRESDTAERLKQIEVYRFQYRNSCYVIANLLVEPNNAALLFELP